MKTIFKWPNHFWFALALCAMIFSGCSCSAPKQTPDPLAGWQKVYNHDPDSAIVKDYQNYIHTLSPEEQEFATFDYLYEDGAGQHAVLITVGINHTDWEHVLIYDKDNKRIKTIKYISGHSAS